MEAPKSYLNKKDFLGVTVRMQISDIYEQTYFRKIDKTQYKGWCMIVTGVRPLQTQPNDHTVNWLFYSDFKKIIEVYGNDEKLWKGKLIDITAMENGKDNFIDWIFTPVV
jgi:hypothetical protein